MKKLYRYADVIVAIGYALVCLALAALLVYGVVEFLR